jgi:hypothetical protein
MNEIMAAEEKVRIVVQAEGDLRDALRLGAAKRGVEMSELAADLLRGGLVEELAEVRRRKQGEAKKKKPESN